MPPFGKIEPTFSNDDDEEDNLARIAQEATQVEMPSAHAAIEGPEDTHVFDSDLAEFGSEVAPQSKLNKKRLLGLIILLAVIISAVVFAGDIFNLASETVKDKIDEVEDIAKIHSPNDNPFIDDGEDANKFLKENADAKQANVSVFDFDINNCLQQYSEEQCTDMYEKNLLINEKK